MSTLAVSADRQLTPRDYKSDLPPIWCPGCGDFGVLSALFKALSVCNLDPERTVVVSGIGCSSRLPGFVAAYGFHGVHGRVLPIATGIKSARPDLNVIGVGGDGDGYSIGGGHLPHAARRNPNLVYLIMNNNTYGLTKGQYSPTSKKGLTTKTSPYGTIEEPFKIGELTIGANGRFFARTVDYNLQLSNEVYKEAAKFHGTAVVEVIQNCVIFNDGVHDSFTSKENRDENTITLHHGEKMIFGKNRDKGIILKDLKLRVVTIGQDGITEDDILTHDAHEPNPGIHYRLAGMGLPEYPVALGVIRAINDQTYDAAMIEQHERVQAKSGIRTVDDLLRSGSTWEVK